MNGNVAREVDGNGVVKLRFADDRIRLELADASLPLGSFTQLLALLPHEPPTAGELENAIAEIEDRLMPVLKALPAARRLSSDEALLHELAAHMTPPATTTLDIDAVERLFNRLADVASGLPAARAGIPPERAFAAALLLVREVMHHGGFPALALVRQRGGSAGSTAAP
jgi:hypothetical protein